MGNGEMSEISGDQSFAGFVMRAICGPANAVDT